MKKIGILALVLVLAFSALGIGYAHWSQTLYVEGSVETGSFGIGFTELTCAEKHVDPATGIKQNGEYEGKDVADYTCEMVDLITINGKSGYARGVVTITDAYPCYWMHMTFAVTNLGSIPVHFKELRISDPTGELNFEWVTPPPASPATGFMWKDFNGNGVYDDPDEEILNFEVINLISMQLHPCSTTKAEVDVHVKQSAEQKHTYNFLVEIVGNQWNLD